MKEHVIFHDRFVSMEDLKEFVSRDRCVSHALSQRSTDHFRNLGPGLRCREKPWFSTPYWHAQELLADGKGVLVPSRDSDAIARGVCELLEDPARMDQIRQRAYEAGRSMIWPAVAEQYLESFRRAAAERTSVPRAAFASWTLATRYELPVTRLDHLFRMTDGTGMFQHATFNVPNFNEGYCVDDVARAFILCNQLDEHGARNPTENLDGLVTTYLAFLAAAMNRDNGRFRNFMSHDRRWLEEAGSEDSHARGLWAVGVGAGRSRNDGHRLLCINLFEAGLPVVESFTSPRAWATTLLALHEYLRTFPGEDAAVRMRQVLTDKLVTLWKGNASDDWPWFENVLSYDNARLSQALITSGHSLANQEALEIGLSSLQWLTTIQTTLSGHFRPVGSNGFYQKNGIRADFDQQPLEAQAMVSACHDAWRATSLPLWRREAKRAFEWFLGRNDLGLPLYDSRTGGCCDGLHPDRVNANQGAESTLAFALSLAEMHHAENVLAEPMKQSA